jgi:hypothetical protein
MTELTDVLKTYNNHAFKTLQGPASLFFNTSSDPYQKRMKREIESPPQPSQEDDNKHFSPSPSQANKNFSATSVIERNNSSPQRDYSESPVIFAKIMQPIKSQPILAAPDSEKGSLAYCRIESKAIGCFEIGGESRLCFPQILCNIFKEIPLEVINKTSNDLRIQLLLSTPEQLAEFKMANILPPNVPRCGLITRTNAERLCSELLHKPPLKKKDPNNFFSFRVYHRCFGKCEGICTPELFSFHDRSCIECVECHGIMSPDKFVLHVCKNKPKENFTCHWGFDSNKWRSYILVHMSETDQETCSRKLDEILLREREFEKLFYEQSLREESNNLKRKVS